MGAEETELQSPCGLAPRGKVGKNGTMSINQLVFDPPAPHPMTSPPLRAVDTISGPERMRLQDISVFYDGVAAVKQASLSIHKGEVLALIGPSGCGKTTLLRTLNRLTELTPNASHSGTITLDGEDIHELEDTRLRARVSMVFQQPNPFPMSIFDNVAFALREQSRRRPRRQSSPARPESAARPEERGRWRAAGAGLLRASRRARPRWFRKSRGSAPRTRQRAPSGRRRETVPRWLRGARTSRSPGWCRQIEMNPEAPRPAASGRC